MVIEKEIKEPFLYSEYPEAIQKAMDELKNMIQETGDADVLFSKMTKNGFSENQVRTALSALLKIGDIFETEKGFKVVGS